MNKAWCALLLTLSGCIRDAGECWVRGEEAGGVGGGVIVGAGAGGFGDVPPEPQAESGAVSGDPCVQTAECEVTWSAGSDVCKSKGTAGTCRTFYQGPHRSLDEAKATCDHIYGVGKNPDVQSCGGCVWAQSAKDDPVERCKKLCDKANQDCIANCPKGDKSCMYKCNLAYAECLKECEK